MASHTYSRPLVALLVSVLLLSGASARGGGGGGKNSGGGDDTSSSDGCCYGSNSKCASASESQCATYAKRLGCEWRAGADASCTDDDEPAGADGCCVGSSSKCDGVDESKCSRLSRQGCEWTYTCDGGDDDEPTEPGCCLGDHAKCAVDDQASCDKVPNKFNCNWATGDECTPAPPTPEPTVEPGCCFGVSANCDVDDEAKCLRLSARNGCEWRTGYEADCSADVATPAPTTPEPTAKPTEEPTPSPTGCPTNHRHRQAWGELTDEGRQLYIDGYLKLSKKGLTQRSTQAHLLSSEHTVPEFLPWHREFIYQMENNIRALGGEFECFTLPYWDWTDEPTPYDVEVFGESLFILESGLGGDGQGECMQYDEVWGKGGYSPSESFAEDFPENAGFDDCLLRDVDYTTHPQCTFFSAAQMMDLIDRSVMFGIFRPWLEGIPHALPHACFGGEKFGHMATIYSPDDPFFYLLHGFVDYQWALWQDCNGYDQVDPQSYTALMYDDDVNQMLDFYPMIDFEYPLPVANTLDLAAYDVSYSKGRFWQAAHVDDSCLDISWFYDEPSVSADVANQRKPTPSQQVQEAMYQTLQNEYADATQREKVHAWAVGDCNVRHFDSAAVEGAEVCVGGVHVDAARCDTFPRDPDTGDIIATLEELTEGLPQCLADQRASWFEFIEVNHWHSLYELCQGCLDDVCDRSELLMDDDKCLFNRKVSVQRVRAREGHHGSSVFSTLVSARAISVDTLGLMGMAGMVVAGLGMALKRMCENKEGKKNRDRAAYGSMQ